MSVMAQGPAKGILPGGRLDAHSSKIEEPQKYYLFFGGVKIELNELLFLRTAVLHNKAGMWQGNNFFEPLMGSVQRRQIEKVFVAANAKAAAPVNGKAQLFFNAVNDKWRYKCL
jgi:hypothetical protein